MTTNVADEEEVWAGEVAYWDTLKAFDLDRYASLWHESVVGWPHGQPAPIGKSMFVKLAGGAMEVLLPGSGEVQLKRISVHVQGGVGISYLQVHWCATTNAGAEIRFDERITHTWLRTHEGWKIIGGMSAPAVADTSARL
jgi:ketosteroid isomerase-like protein